MDHQMLATAGRCYTGMNKNFYRENREKRSNKVEDYKNWSLLQLIKKDWRNFVSKNG